MTRNKIIPYNPKLKTLARELRKNSTLSEVILWNKIKGKKLGYDDQRQKKLELIGIEIVRFLDKDIKKGLNDVLRILENCVEERSSKKETTSPWPPSKGEFSMQDSSVNERTSPMPTSRQGGVKMYY